MKPDKILRGTIYRDKVTNQVVTIQRLIDDHMLQSLRADAAKIRDSGLDSNLLEELSGLVSTLERLRDGQAVEVHALGIGYSFANLDDLEPTNIVNPSRFKVGDPVCIYTVNPEGGHQFLDGTVIEVDVGGDLFFDQLLVEYRFVGLSEQLYRNWFDASYCRESLNIDRIMVTKHNKLT